MPKHFLTLIIALIVGSGFAVSTRNDTLYVSVCLAKNDSISISSQYMTVFEERDGLLKLELSGRIELVYERPAVSSVFRLATSVDSLAESTQITVIPKWKDGSLSLKEHRTSYYPEVFSSYADARTKAQELGQPLSSIVEVEDPDAVVKVTCPGRSYYLQLPVRLYAEKGLNINGNKYLFKGEFDLKIYKEKLLLNASLPLEDYVKGVVPNEIGDTAPEEALKAQAITARTHAVSLLLYGRHKADGYDLCNGTHCQVYRGTYLVNSKVVQAVEDTRGLVVLYENKLADTPYHSSCGGKTDSSAKIWNGTELPYLLGVNCESEVDTLDLTNEEDVGYWLGSEHSMNGMQSWEKTSTSWERSINMAQLANNLELEYITGIEVLERGRSGRITKMKITGNNTKLLSTESAVRSAFGGLPSSCFITSFTPDNGNPVTSTLKITGRGSGHGVGMCQVGALKMSREGFSHAEIISKYYPGTVLAPLRITHE